MELDAFTVQLAPNGGWIVRKMGRPGDEHTLLASFSNAIDLIDWIERQIAPDIAGWRDEE